MCIELYVRGVAIDLNGLERVNADKDALKLAEISLAEQVSNLAELVCASNRICKEVALAAFSLHPTQERFDKLVELATKVNRASASLSSPGAVIDDVASDSGQSSSVKEDLEDADSGFDSSAATNEEEEIADPISSDDDMMYSKLDADNLGVSESMVEDLGTVVDSCQWRVFSWQRGWPALKSLCQEYLADPGKMRSVVEVLKFLKLDKKHYKKGSTAENDLVECIEKGYDKTVKRRRKYVKANPKRLKKPIASKNSRKKSEKRQVSKKKPTKTSSVSEKSLDLIQPMTTATVETEAQPEQVEIPAEIMVCLYFSLVPAHVINICNFVGQESHATSSPINAFRALRCRSSMPNFRLCFDTEATQPPLFKPAEDLPPRPDPAHHFAPMLSTLNLEPIVVMKRLKVLASSVMMIKKNGTKPVPKTTEGQLIVEDSPQSSGGTEPTPSTSSAEKDVEMDVEMEEDQPDGRVEIEVVEQRNSRELSLNQLHLYSAYLLILLLFYNSVVFARRVVKWNVPHGKSRKRPASESTPRNDDATREKQASPPKKARRQVPTFKMSQKK